MEYTNLSHQHLHQQQFSRGSSSFPHPSFHGAQSNQSWIQSLTHEDIGGRCFSPDGNGIMLSSSVLPRDLKLEEDKSTFNFLPNSHDLNSSCMFQELGFQEEVDPKDLNEKLFSFSRSRADDDRCSRRGSFSRIYPTATISASTPNPAASFSSVITNYMALPFGLLNLQEPTLEMITSNNNHKVSFMNGISVGETRRRNGVYEKSRVCHSQGPMKRPRFDSRPSLPPMKVRKEKLGDRISALQQLVAPFGKTDTASVLMEAIGYIKFLQDQVETLSRPYMKSTGKHVRGTLHEGGSSEEMVEVNEDLRSRGLCLFPLSCTSYLANDNDGVWSTPYFSDV